MRESRSDERLDDFRGEVNRRFDSVEKELATQRSEMGDGFKALQRLIIQVGGGMIGTFIVAAVTTQL